MYGVQTHTRVVAAPAPTCNYKCYGMVLSLLAAITISVTVANVILTVKAYCTPWSDANNCSTTKEPYIWVWVASGIWGSVPIFFAGLLAMCISYNTHWSKCFSFLIFLSALVFAPGIVVLTAIEIWRCGCSDYGAFYVVGGNGSALSWGTIGTPDSPYQAKFAFPMVVTIIGGFMFLMTAPLTWMLCCRAGGFGFPSAHETTEIVSVPKVSQQQTAIRPMRADVYHGSNQPQNQYISNGGFSPYNGFSPNVGTRYNPGNYKNFESFPAPDFNRFSWK